MRSILQYLFFRQLFRAGYCRFKESDKSKSLGSAFAIEGKADILFHKHISKDRLKKVPFGTVSKESGTTKCRFEGMAESSKDWVKFDNLSVNKQFTINFWTWFKLKMVQGPATILFAFFRGFPPLKQLPNDGSSRSGYDEEIPSLRFDKVSIRYRPLSPKSSSFCSADWAILPPSPPSILTAIGKDN